VAIAIALRILAALQLALPVLDIRERVRTWPAQGTVERFAPRSAVFLVVVVLFYSAIQFGGLALVPGVAEMLETARKIFVLEPDCGSRLAGDRQRLLLTQSGHSSNRA
jgi:hypothetical protein